MLRPLPFAVGFIASILANTASAVLVFYTNRAAFQAASGTLTLESLDSLTTSGGNSTTQPSGVTLTGGGTGSFSTESSFIFISEGSGSLVTASWDVGDTMTFSFATPITAFGVDFLDSTDPFNMDLTVDGASLNVTSNQDQTSTTNGPLFFGVRDTTGSFSQAVITSHANNNTVNFDYIQFQAVAVPEPSAFLYGGLIAALVGSSCWVRRKLSMI